MPERHTIHLTQAVRLNTHQLGVNNHAGTAYHKSYTGGTPQLSPERCKRKQTNFVKYGEMGLSSSLLVCQSLTDHLQIKSVMAGPEVHPAMAFDLSLC